MYLGDLDGRELVVWIVRTYHPLKRPYLLTSHISSDELTGHLLRSQPFDASPHSPNVLPTFGTPHHCEARTSVSLSLVPITAGPRYWTKSLEWRPVDHHWRAATSRSPQQSLRSAQVTTHPHSSENGIRCPSPIARNVVLLGQCDSIARLPDLSPLRRRVTTPRRNSPPTWICLGLGDVSR